jgi:deoxyribose-phosphate aldolase
MIDRNELIEVVTRQVLATLAGQPTDQGLENAPQVVANGAARLGYCGAGADVPKDLAQYIDHTLLRPDASPADIDTLCDEAVEYGFAAVCINPSWVARAKKRLRTSGITLASVVGFPLGANTPEIKAVINIGALKGGEHDLVQRDIAGVSDACREVGGLNKVIIEAAYLTDEEKVVACRLAVAGRAHYVKTSTGFGPGGATVFDVALMREVVGAKVGVKAAGGIHTADEVREMITAGATRIGASAGVRIVSGEEGESGGSY